MLVLASTVTVRENSGTLSTNSTGCCSTNGRTAEIAWSTGVLGGLEVMQNASSPWGIRGNAGHVSKQMSSGRTGVVYIFPVADAT